MVNNIKYEDFMNEFKNKRIKKIIFSVDNYNHYRHCEIEVEKEMFPNSNTESYNTLIKLVPDDSETMRCEFPFEESLKLFKMGRTKSYTLKQIWYKLNIHEIIYSNDFKTLIAPTHSKIKIGK